MWQVQYAPEVQVGFKQEAGLLCILQKFEVVKQTAKSQQSAQRSSCKPPRQCSWVLSVRRYIGTFFSAGSSKPGQCTWTLSVRIYIGIFSACLFPSPVAIG